MVVTYIQKRLRGAGIIAYDFLPATFGEAMRGEYHNFSRVNDLGKFSFSNSFGNQGLPNMRWCGNVEVLYNPVQVDGRHWVGIVIDIGFWCIHVLDCNSTCVTDVKLEALLQPIVVLMPLLIRLNGGKALVEAAMDFPMPITRIDLPFLCEPPGLSCVVALLVMELHATQCLDRAGTLTDDALAIAAQTYAFEAFSTFNPDELEKFIVA
ncbi:hypothetical protein N665_1284s0002 [Sinapis alba]|nr:hypothetical protein N665_1284s0002 [Sinapis alba]